MNRRAESYLKWKINLINLSSVAEIEEKLDPYDLYSLVFLLYDVPATALIRLSALSRASSDHASSLILDWASASQRATTKTSWRYELLEALTICQLNNIIKILGFNVELVQEYFQPENLRYNMISNPIKKVLYKLCENITSENLAKLRATLKTYGLKVDEYNNCEMLILEMICNDLIFIGEESGTNQTPKNNCSVEFLAKIVEKIGLAEIAKDLRVVEMKYKIDRNLDEIIIKDHVIETTLKDININVEDKKSKEKDLDQSDKDKKVTANDLHDIFTMINDTKENPILEHLKSDTIVYNKRFYPIKNRDRLGICCIINQEDFYPSKQSIESGVPPLAKRVGSNKDKTSIEETMSIFSFEVKVHTNVTDEEMLDNLKHIVKAEVKSDDSMFFLFILSHGEGDCVYAANSVRVKVDIIKNLLEKSFARRNLNDIPKILIIQACQDTKPCQDDIKLCQNDDKLRQDDVKHSQDDVKMCQDDAKLCHENAELRIDGARYMPKSNFLDFWATLPKHCETEDGSIFIQSLCSNIRKYANCEHLEDILTRVKNDVSIKCSVKIKEQLTMHCSTLSKKVYLVAPVEK